MEYIVATNNKNYFTPLVYRVDLDSNTIIKDIGKYSLKKMNRVWRSGNFKDIYNMWNAIFLFGNSVFDKSIIEIKNTPILSMKIELSKFVIRETIMFDIEKKRSLKSDLEVLQSLYKKTELKTTVTSDGFYIYLLILLEGITEDNELRDIIIQSMRDYISSLR